MAYTRITALWNGATGLPGYSRFKFAGDLDSAGAAAAAARLRTFFDSVKALIPSAINITFAETAQVFSVDQQLTGEITYAPPAAVAGTSSGNFAGPTGMVINWVTSAFIGGRKVRGRTFMVPLGTSVYGPDGTPTSIAVTTLTSGAAALAAGTPSLVIASHPSEGVYSTAGVSGASVPKRVAVLRSRRD